MKQPEKKRRLGGAGGFFGSEERVYAVADGLVVDCVDHGTITRSRVFYDDVLMVTRHRMRGWLFLTLTGLAAAGFGLPGVLLLADRNAFPAGVIFLVIAVVFAVPCALRAALGLDVITVYGKRTKAVVRFWLRKERAQMVHAQVIDAVRRAQAAAADRYAAERAAYGESAPEGPPPPERGLGERGLGV
ncbi:MAG: hypothetical protein HZA54_20335 [Planctomycetes bacterium]|nr:hypothetical protein [Planctomycetota bacterium]